MAACHPGLRIHQYGGIQTNIVFVFLNKFFAPGIFNVVFQFNAKRAEIPCVGKAAVDLRAGIYETSALAERNKRVQ